ncbi:unnamed protein product [Calicophoron daubneyi]|uniref:Nodal modulator 1 n=1 Tax=Calicophoron daubneyi TaxID=300641 RepID=A0AAV2TN43_CALDB
MYHNSPRASFSSLQIMLKLIVFLLLFVTEFLDASDTVIGCGGFIRWKSDETKTEIDYQKLKVKLYSEQTATLKEVTGVLPNGAFSVPLYDRGVYRLKLATPMGWHVSPAGGHLLDLASHPDACTSDFNFLILGFSVFGQVVTYGLTTGPTDLFIRLTSVTGELLASNTTRNDGYFTLSPVLPGEYSLTVSDNGEAGSPRIRARSTLSLGADSLTLKNPLVLLGHFARGHVVDFTGKPVVGATVYLVADPVVDLSAMDCASVYPVTGSSVVLPSELHKNGKIVCETKTDATGQFSFDRLPGGKYALFPHHVIEFVDPVSSILVEFNPVFARIFMQHTDVDLGASSFTAVRLKFPPGRVTWRGGDPITNAKVFLGGGGHPLVTDKDGLYHFGYLKPGRYVLKVEADGALFDPATLDLSPALKQLPNLSPSKLAICGKLESMQDLSVFEGQLEASVLIKSSSPETQLRQMVSFRGGKLQFCAFLPPGQYTVTPEVKIMKPTSKNLHFAPPNLSVNLSTRPVFDVVFTQFRAKLTGKITCVESCLSRASLSDNEIVVRLSPSEDSAALDESLFSKVKVSKDKPSTATFEFNEVPPGDYIIEVVLKNPKMDGAVSAVDGWCWQSTQFSETNGMNIAVDSSARRLRVSDSDLTWTTENVLHFVQTGYANRVELQLPSNIERLPPVVLQATESLKSGNVTTTREISWKLKGSSNMICLPSPSAQYRFKALSACLKFASPSDITIQPSKDCHPQLIRNPIVRLSVSALPVFIQLQYSTNILNVPKRFGLTGSPISIEVEQISGQPSELKPGKRLTNLQARWSVAKSGSPVADAILWVAPDSRLRLKPMPPRLDGTQWLYTYLIQPVSKELNYYSVPPPHLKHPSGPSSLLYPESNFSVNSVQPINEFDPQCEIIRDGQIVRFDLLLSVVLRGVIHPPVAKVEVALNFRSLPQEEDVPSSGRNQPLLPIHNEAAPPTKSKESGNDRDKGGPVRTTLTDTNGVFLFGPIAMNTLPFRNEVIQKYVATPSELFTVELTKPGYEFVQSVQPQDLKSLWLFKSTKLSLVEVLVSSEEDGKQLPLAGVLISIIGEGHRGNQFTDHSGLAHFVGLAPGLYYLRPMMKEYVFTVVEPKSESTGQESPIVITEGVSVQVKIQAKRTAFSVSGLVTSLARMPESGVLVEAEWLLDPPKNLPLLKFSPTSETECPLGPDDIATVPHEQARTNANGTFLIRGLIPGCIYSVSVHTDLENQLAHNSGLSAEGASDSGRVSAIERAIPASIYLVMPSHDATGLEFYAVRLLHMSTLTVSVDTEDEYIPSLRLTLYPLDRPDQVVAKHDFGSDSLLFFLTGPKLGSIVGLKHVLRLESSLEPSFYEDIEPQEIIIKPKLNESEHWNFSFHPKLRSVTSEQKLSRQEL